MFVLFIYFAIGDLLGVFLEIIFLPLYQARQIKILIKYNISIVWECWMVLVFSFPSSRR